MSLRRKAALEKLWELELVNALCTSGSSKSCLSFGRRPLMQCPHPAPSLQSLLTIALKASLLKDRWYTSVATTNRL